MKIFTAQQIRDGDAYTIQHEPVKSIDLMERAAGKCVQWIKAHYSPSTPFYIFCGTGNNGGDGLAVARILREAGYNVHVYIVLYSERFSEDCTTNRKRLEHLFGSCLFSIHTMNDFPALPENAILVDALFGTGLSRPLKGLSAEVVNRINDHTQQVISIDMPSGLKADEASEGYPVVQATHTLSFQFYKLAFLMPDNEKFIGKVHILPIGIHRDYIKNTPAPYQYVDEKIIRSMLKKRQAFSHKGNYGHVLLMAGSFGKMGACVLANKAAVRSGAGLVTCFIPACGYLIMQTAIPEVMCLCDKEEDCLSEIPEKPEQYSAIGIGPGIGQHQKTVDALKKLLSVIKKPMVLDADALNIMGKHKALLKEIPPHSLLTPHPREFERLFGKTKNSFERLTLQLKKSKEHNLYILLKGHRTCITSPDGQVFFNSMGNAGMATGGSGDVLTGLLTGLLAQGYKTGETAVLGAFLHGFAGDLAAADLSEESLIASDIIAYFGKAYKKINGI